MRIPLLYRGEYSQWNERFMNYLEEQTDGEAMINCIKHGDQPLPRVIQVSIAGTSSNEQPPLKDKSMWSDQEKRFKRLIHGDQPLPRVTQVSIAGTSSNEQPPLKDKSMCNKIAKDLWDALARYILGSEYGEQDRKAEVCMSMKRSKLPKENSCLTLIFDTYKDINDATGLKKKTVVVTSDPLALIAEKMKSATKKQEYVMSDDKKVEKKDDEKKQDMSKVKCYNCKKEGHFAKDYKKAKVKDYEYYKTKMLLAKKDKDEQVLLAEDHAWMESSTVDHNDYEGIDKLIRKFNKKIAKCLKHIEKANQQNKDFKNQNKDLQDKYDVLKNQATTFEMKNDELNEQMKVLIEKNDDLLTQTNALKDQLQVKHVVIDTHVECQEKYAKLEAERYEYMIRYSSYFDNDKQHRKQIADQEVLYDKMSVQLVELDKHNVHMIMPSKDKMYNGRKGIGLENLSYFCKAKDLRPTLYDERFISLGYQLMFLTHFDEALEIKKFERARENKIEFDYDYGNLNASYVNEKINFLDYYFQEIINPDSEKIDSLFQQTSSLKPYVPTVILKKIIINVEDEVVSLLDKEKENLKIIESLKSKGCESSENVISELENQSVNDCQVVEKGCDNSENSNRYSHKNLMACNNSDIRSVFDCNNARNALCNARMNASIDVNDLFVFDDIVHICLWIIDLSCLKHMTGNHALLMNFVEKFLGMVRFGNKVFAVIAGYGDVVIVSMMIKKVYYVEGLGHNLFSIGQFYDKCLEVTFRKSTCFVRTDGVDLLTGDRSKSTCFVRTDGVDLLTGDRSSNLYTIALNKVVSNSLACLLAKASSSQSWLWHQRLCHLNFTTINNLVKINLVQGLPKMKFEKDHLCSACKQGKIHRKHHKSKTVFALNKPLYLLRMDLCGPIHVESINGKRYVLVVINDFSRYTWHVRTDNGTEFKNKTLAKFFDEVGITQQFSAAKTPQQNGVVERRNRTLVEAARTMLTFANLTLFLWDEAIATACFTQNCLIIHKRFDKTPYELMNKRKPNIKFYRMFGCRCYLLNEYDDVGKLKAKRNIRVFVGYSKESASFRIYNK
nr:hypothetical protein [Tanacetum cinerariifolium]